MNNQAQTNIKLIEENIAKTGQVKSFKKNEGFIHTYHAKICPCFYCSLQNKDNFTMFNISLWFKN